VLLDSQKRCRIFATIFTNTLPLELRDMVYTELWSRQRHDHDHPSLREGTIDEPKDPFDPRKSAKGDRLWRFNREGKSCQCFNWWDLSLWLQPEWVGPNVAQEAAKAHYRSLSKHPDEIRHANDALDVADLGDYLLKDHFHLGIRLADHMRSVCLVVKATYYNGLAGAYDHDEGCSARHPTEHDLEQDKHRVVAMESLSTLTSMLRPLLEIPQKKNFRLKIFFKDGSDYQKLEAFRPVVRAFVDAGACVFLVSPAPSSGKDIKYNERDYFDMSLQDWLNGYIAAAKARQLEKNERIKKCVFKTLKRR